MNFLPEKNMGYLHIIFWKKMFCAKKVTKLPDLTVLVDLLSLKTYINVPTISNKRKNLHLESQAINEMSRILIRIHNPVVRIRIRIKARIRNIGFQCLQWRILFSKLRCDREQAVFTSSKSTVRIIIWKHKSYCDKAINLVLEAGQWGRSQERGPATPVLFAVLSISSQSKGNTSTTWRLRLLFFVYYCLCPLLH